MAVIPAHAGIQLDVADAWIPAFARMTALLCSQSECRSPLLRSTTNTDNQQQTTTAND
jgi:hypothetical protein